MAEALPSGTGRSPWRALLRAVLELAGPHAELVRHGERGWASATFAGSRHSVSLSFSGASAMDAADDFIAALPEHEFALPGRIVADATIVAVDQRALPHPHTLVEAELLLLDEG
jgi:hypothetical protein